MGHNYLNIRTRCLDARQSANTHEATHCLTMSTPVQHILKWCRRNLPYSEMHDDSEMHDKHPGQSKMAAIPLGCVWQGDKLVSELVAINTATPPTVTCHPATPHHTLADLPTKKGTVGPCPALITRASTSPYAGEPTTLAQNVLNNSRTNKLVCKKASPNVCRNTVLQRSTSCMPPMPIQGIRFSTTIRCPAFLYHK